MAADSSTPPLKANGSGAETGSPPATSRPHRVLISDLCDQLETYLPPDQVREIYRAYLLAAEAHDGQRRKTGEPYIYHPVAVSKILADLRLDAETLQAAILHDVLEDTPINKLRLQTDFGESVADLVDGVSKLGVLGDQTRAEAQAASFRKMLLAMTRDVRVIMIKLADRLHNMRTLNAMPAQRRWAIARETLDIYAPIATRLGINRMRIELEDLCFENLHPWRARILRTAVAKVRGNRGTVLDKVAAAINQGLAQEAIAAQVICREKHLYGIYRKMVKKDRAFKEVDDVYAVRLVVDKVDTCYRVLGIMHAIYKPVPGKFKDYIAIPKTNGYQSLHSILFGPHGAPMEVQIRTEAMHQVAENGIAAHWLYKSESDERDNGAQTRTRRWLQRLLEMQSKAGDSVEFLESVKVDLFPDEVYVFTPVGDIVELPRGATPVDFAYAIHSDVGHTCIAAKVDRRWAPLSSELQSGQTVEIVTAQAGRPNPAWLNFVATGRARSAIRHFLKGLRRDEAVALGRRLMDKALSTEGLTMTDMNEEQLSALLNEMNLARVDDLLAEIGLGRRTAGITARAVIKHLDGVETARRQSPLPITGSEGLVLSYGKCCRPVPGDNVVGVASAGKGLVVHRQECRNVARRPKERQSWVDLRWSADISGLFQVALRVDVDNRRGVLAQLAAAIADTDSNIEHVSMDEKDEKISMLSFIIGVRDRKHVADILRLFRRFAFVTRSVRV